MVVVQKTASRFQKKTASRFLGTVRVQKIPRRVKQKTASRIKGMVVVTNTARGVRNPPSRAQGILNMAQGMASGALDIPSTNPRKQKAPAPSPNLRSKTLARESPDRLIKSYSQTHAHSLGCPALLRSRPSPGLSPRPSPRRRLP
jgi:hypothetical protein